MAKKLTKKIKRHAGRSKGKITVRRKGGGAKKLYRLVSFGQEKKDMQGEVVSIEYDPYRTADIIKLEYEDGSRQYRIAPHGIEVGDKVVVSDQCESSPGNRMRLENIPIGTPVYNVELLPNQGGKMMRSAGSSAEVLGQEGKHVILKMPSKEVRKVHSQCFATIGRVSNPEHRFEKEKKAGTGRHKGRRPKVRGTAMPAGPHPHGGGEGKTSIGLKHPKTPWGKIAHGGKTRRRKHTDKYIIKRRNEK